jgi:hypothetical protein
VAVISRVISSVGVTWELSAWIEIEFRRWLTAFYCVLLLLIRGRLGTETVLECKSYADNIPTRY